jgi:hypothetical protein
MEPQGEFFADKIMDLANLVAAALVFGPFVAGEIHWLGIALGVSFFCFATMLSYVLRRKKVKE